MKQLIAFLSLLVFAGFADGLMEVSMGLFVLCGVLVLGGAYGLVTAEK